MQGTFLDVRGAKLWLRRDGAGAPILFLHGVHGLADDSVFIARLAMRCAVTAPDHPGFGRSDTPDWIETVEDLAFFYLDFLKLVAKGRVHVVGHSLGGWIALAMAIRSTQQIQDLTLIDAAGISVPGVPRGDMFIGSAQETGRLLFADEDAAARWQALSQASEEARERYDKNRAAAAKYTWQPRLYDPRLARWLHRIDVPTHIVWGEADRLIPPAHGETLQRLVPGARLTLLPSVGHLGDVEAPARLADAILPFIAGSKP